MLGRESPVSNLRGVLLKNEPPSLPAVFSLRPGNKNL